MKNLLSIPAFDVKMQIPVMEHFYTLQGEGAHTGKAAYFIRLAGCDVGCTWCDVKESWEVSKEQLLSINDLVSEMQKFPARLAVITGGEPLIYDLTFLTQKLKNAGFSIHIETSGAYPLNGHLDWICLSPKKFKAPLNEVITKADELKVIVYNKTDFAFGEEFTQDTKSSCRLFLQPEWSKRAQMVPLIIDYIKQNPQWQISVQTHKYLDIP